jgi:hypothetical protein
LNTFLESKIGQNKFLESDNGPCHVSGIFLPLRVNSLPLATIYEVKIPLRKWKKSLLQRNPAQMTWAIIMTRLSIFLGVKIIYKINNITKIQNVTPF